VEASEQMEKMQNKDKKQLSRPTLKSSPEVEKNQQ